MCTGSCHPDSSVYLPLLESQASSSHVSIQPSSQSVSWSSQSGGSVHSGESANPRTTPIMFMIYARSISKRFNFALRTEADSIKIPYCSQLHICILQCGSLWSSLAHLIIQKHPDSSRVQCIFYHFITFYILLPLMFFFLDFPHIWEMTKTEQQRAEGR